MKSLFLAIAMLLAVLVGQPAPAQDTEFAPVELPDWLAEKTSGLPVDKVEFLRGEGVLAFAARHELLFRRFEQKSGGEIEAYIDAMIRVNELSAFDPDRDQASIPLNTESEWFNGWKSMRPAEFDTPRAPGPINLHRYMYERPQLGIPTFFQLPVALTPEDLVAGKVDVAIAGVGLDTGSGYRGAGFAPRALRTGQVYKGMGMVEDEHMHTMVSGFNELTIVDYGDIATDWQSAERSVHHIRDMVRGIADTGTIPMLVGGDHSIMYPDVAGVVDVYGAGNVGVVHFDAHYDAGRGAPHLISHGQPVARLFAEELVPGRNFIQVGLRGPWPSRSGFEWMRENGLRYHTMAEIEKKGWDAVMKKVLAEALDGPEYFFISFDVDVLDPAYMPGTGTPEPNGLTPREVFPLVRRLCAENQVIGFEIVEVNPLVDPGYTTAQNSTQVLRECLNGIALRKTGITENNYLSPLTTDHAQDK